MSLDEKYAESINAIGLKLQRLNNNDLTPNAMDIISDYQRITEMMLDDLLVHEHGSTDENNADEDIVEFDGAITLQEYGMMIAIEGQIKLSTGQELYLDELQMRYLKFGVVSGTDLSFAVTSSSCV